MAKPSIATATKKTKAAPPVTPAVATNTKVKAAKAPATAREARAQAAAAEDKAPRAQAANRSTGERIDVSRKLKVLAKENPKRPGTKAHEMWEKYKTGQTVAEARQAGVSMADLQWNIAHGFLALA